MYDLFRAARTAAITVAVFGVPLCGVPLAVSASPACADNTIYAVDSTGKNLYVFTPPSPTVTLLSALGTQVGTISRGTATGNIYAIAPTTSNSPLYSIPTGGASVTQVGTLPNTAFVYASGFENTGTGYALSSTESFAFTDSNPSTITKLAAPQTSAGPPLSSFNSGDLAFDKNNQGWTVLTSAANANSYLYKVSFGAQTLLTEIAQVSLNGAPYTTGDLYDFAFGPGNVAYVSGGKTGELYSIDLTSGDLTAIGSQGADLYDFASCPFYPFPNPAISKTGPAQIAPGDLIEYTIFTRNDPTATAAATSVKLSDPVPSGITIVSASCTGAGGVICPSPTISGQTVSTTIASIPAGGSATLLIFAKDASLPLGATTNTATFSAANASTTNASSTVTVVANTVTKTVANITKATAAAQSDTGVPGDTLEYVLSYTNMTNQNLAGFALNDVVPLQTTFVSGSAVCLTVPSGLTCTPSGPASGKLTWGLTGGSLAPGATVSVRFRVKID